MLFLSSFAVPSALAFATAPSPVNLQSLRETVGSQGRQHHSQFPLRAPSRLPSTIIRYRLDNEFTRENPSFDMKDAVAQTSKRSPSEGYARNVYKSESRPKHQSDVFSLLPKRVSTIERMDTPTQFQSQVLDEKSSLVVVRFYADACATCRATTPLFRRWSRDIEQRKDNYNGKGPTNNVKVVEMPLNRATSAFLLDTLQIEQLPYCHLYHPQLGLVEEHLVVNKYDFQDFITVVDDWTKRIDVVDVN